MIDTLEALAKAGCSFVVHVPAVGGYKTCNASPEQALRLLEDPTAVYGELVGLSRTDYVEWEASQGSVYCSAKTSRGDRCRKHVLGATLLEPHLWKKVKEVGGYCAVHGG